MRSRFAALLIFGIGAISEVHAASVESIVSNVHLGWGVGRLTAGKDSGNSPAWSLIAGYEINQYVTAEVGYLLNNGNPVSVAKPVTGGTEVSTTSSHFWNISGIGVWPFNDTYSVFARVGMLAVGGDSVTVQGTNVTQGNISGNELFYGAGAAFAFGNGSLRLEYQHSNILDQSVSYIGFSAVWKLRR